MTQINTAITAESLVADALRAFPGATAVFLQRRMHCPGCPMAAFMTIAEAAASYGLTADDLLEELRLAALPDDLAAEHPFRGPHL